MEHLMPSPAWVRLWLDRVVSATDDWTAEEYGAYMRLLVKQGLNGSLPNDVSRLARIAGMDRTAFSGIWAALLRFKFEEDPDNPGMLQNPRMAEERAKALGYHAEQSRKSRLGVAARQNPRVNPRVNPGTDPSGSGSGSGSSLSGGESERGSTLDQTLAEPTYEMLRSDVIAKAREWAQYRVENPKTAPWARSTWRANLNEALRDPAGWMVKVDHTIKMGWQGLRAPDEAAKGKAGGGVRTANMMRAFREGQQ